MHHLHALSLATLLCAAVPAVRATVEESASGIPSDIVAKVDPSVVAIKHERAQGSGFVLSADGYILTNGHVARGEDPEDPLKPAESITVLLHDDRMFPATVIGFWMDPDIALIKINPDTPLVPSEMADSRSVRTGQRCFAVGNPAGLKRTYTGGLLSNVDRTDLGTETPVLQTDAAINPGNSGGPLFDMLGRVIGINTYALTDRNNLGFTIPIHVILPVQESIARNGHFIRGELPSVFFGELDEGLSAVTGVKSGVMIHHVEPGSPAAVAGLRAGDVLVALDGKPVVARSRAEALTFEWENITLSPPGRKMKQEVVRPGEPGSRILEVTLVAAAPMPRTERHSGELRPLLVEALGLGVTEIVPAHRWINNLGDDKGVLVSTVVKDSAAGKAGLVNMDILTSVGGQTVTDLPTFKSALLTALGKRGKAFEVEIARGGIRFPSALRPDYPARVAHGLLVTDDTPWTYLDLLQMELAATGGALETISMRNPDAAMLARYASAPPDFLLVCAEQPGGQLPPKIAGLAASVQKNKGVLAATGGAVPLLARALPDVKGRKMTASDPHTGSLSSLGVVFTGMEVESDGLLVTTTARDRNVMRKFIRALLRKIAGEGNEPAPAAK